MTEQLIPWWPLLLALGATRLVQLVMYDLITEPLREAVKARSNRAAEHRLMSKSRVTGSKAWKAPRAWIAELLSCVWCVSIWVSAAIVLLYLIVGQNALWVLLVLALSEVVSVLDRAVDRFFE